MFTRDPCNVEQVVLLLGHPLQLLLHLPQEHLQLVGLFEGRLPTLIHELGKLIDQDIQLHVRYIGTLC